MTRVLSAVMLAVVVTVIVYIDDMIAAAKHKTARYTRVFVLSSGIFWFLMPFLLKRLGTSGHATPLMQQRFDVAPPPF